MKWWKEEYKEEARLVIKLSKLTKKQGELLEKLELDLYFGRAFG